MSKRKRDIQNQEDKMVVLSKLIFVSCCLLFAVCIAGFLYGGGGNYVESGGIVADKLSVPRSSYVEYYIIINTELWGYKELKVDLKTYMQYNKGDKVIYFFEENGIVSWGEGFKRE